MSSAIDRLEALIAAVRVEYCPDPRTAIFEVEARIEDGALELTGAVSEPVAVEALHRRVAMLDGWVEIRDAVTRLPELDGAGPQHAVVTAPVAPMLASPMIASPQISQVVLGHHLIVLRRQGRWLQCRSTDGYLGWMHRGYVVQLQERDARNWDMGTGGEACISLGAELRTADDEVLVRLPWGSRVIRQEDGLARLPNGRSGRLVGDVVPAKERAHRFPGHGDAVVESSPRWLGVPYLWGGVTHGGVDCSGFVQALFRLHGVELPRDSDQQARAGQPVDPGRDFSKLRGGDLCFFAEDADRVTHVVLSTGGSRIIHSSLGNGGVARNDLAGKLEYERELGRIFVCARRVLDLP
jgi:cell wall-associated NlpC family hydrolase